jgi:hypothetical protein
MNISSIGFALACEFAAHVRCVVLNLIKTLSYRDKYSPMVD